MTFGYGSPRGKSWTVPGDAVVFVVVVVAVAAPDALAVAAVD